MSWPKNTLSRLTLAFWMLPIKVFSVFVYYSLRLASPHKAFRSTTLKLPFSERMLRVSTTRTRAWSLTVVSLPRLIPPGTFWRELVIVFSYSTVEPNAEIAVTLYTRFRRVAVAHRHWWFSIRRDPLVSSSLVLPKLSSSRYRMTGSRSGSASTGYVVLTNDDQSVFLRSSPEEQSTDESSTD
jgi:hypothetical protein